MCIQVNMWAASLLSGKLKAKNQTKVSQPSKSSREDIIYQAVKLPRHQAEQFSLKGVKRVSRAIKCFFFFYFSRYISLDLNSQDLLTECLSGCTMLTGTASQSSGNTCRCWVVHCYLVEGCSVCCVIHCYKVECCSVHCFVYQSNAVQCSTFLYTVRQRSACRNRQYSVMQFSVIECNALLCSIVS